LLKFAFKTPTLRSVALHPPYMHNGKATTLYEVVKHYEAGGIDRSSRSAAMMKLELSEQGRLDLVAFMQTLTGIAEGDTPPKLP
jgi:cytochrome c peroxidase